MENEEKYVPKPEEEKNPNIQLMEKIKKRATGASQKVKERIEKKWMPYMQLLVDSSKMSIDYDLSRQQNDFTWLAEYTESKESGQEYEDMEGIEDVYNQHYQGWTAEEIRELYKILYGKDL